MTEQSHQNGALPSFPTSSFQCVFQVTAESSALA
jgi:hypothetical protein